MAQRFRRLVEDYFLKGYNDRDKPETLYSARGSYMADLVNCFVDQNEINKRTGYSSIGNAPVSKAILGQMFHEPHGGTKYILRARNDATDANAVIESWSGTGNWAVLTGGSSQTASSLHEFIPVNDATYIFDDAGDTVLKTTNGTSTSTVAAIPKGKNGRWFHNFFFVYGVSTNQSRLYFSDVNTPETFDAVNGYIDVNPGDGEPITGMAALKDELLIFKRSRVWSLTGFGVDDFTLTDLGNVITGVGTEAPRSIIETGNDAYYLSFQGNVPHFRSIRRTDQSTLVDGGIVSDVITGTMKRVVTSRIPYSAGVFDGRRIWWAVTTDGESANNEVLVYDTVINAWTRHTGIAATVLNVSTISGVPKIYFGSSSANGKSYVLDTSTSDDGENIDFIVKTPFYNPEPGYQCKFKYLYITTDVSSSVNIDVDFSRDGFTFQDLTTLSLTGSGAAFGTAIFDSSRFGSTTINRKRIDTAGGKGYFMQYRFENNSTDSGVVIREWEIFFKQLGLRAA